MKGRDLLLVKTKNQIKLKEALQKKAQKMNWRKKRPYLIAGLIAYSILCLFILHLCAAQTFFPNYDLSQNINVALNTLVTSPFQFIATPQDAGLYIFLLTIAILGLILYFVASENRNQHEKFGTEHGTAAWNTDYDAFNMRFTDPPNSIRHDGNRNMIFTNNVYFSMDTRQTLRNNNILVIGGSGSGKSRFFVKPNICEMPINVSFATTDPSGELIASVGSLLTDNGFKVKCFNLVDMSLGNHYNPLNYINKETDVFVLVDCILKNTTDPQHQGGDDFWEKAQKMMFQAFILALWLHGDDEEIFPKSDGWGKDMASVIRLITGCTISEEDTSSSIDSPTSKIFQKIKKKYSEFDISVKQYDKFMLGAGKTLKSVLISAAARLSVFDGEELIEMTSSDDIELDKIGEEKTALFIVVPQENDSFNFLAAMLYTQLFQSLYFHAGNECQGNYVVTDRTGENVKVFAVPHGKLDICDKDENAEEIEIDLIALRKKMELKEALGDTETKKINAGKEIKEAKISKSSRLLMKNKKIKEPKAEEEAKSIEEFDIKAMAEEEISEEELAKTLPNKDPGEENKSVEQQAQAYIERLKEAKLIKKGSKYYIKIAPEKEGLPDEIVGNAYTSLENAVQKIENLKHCSIKRLGQFLPYHVRFLLDEFANIGQIPQFNQKLATMRKYEISCSIILQSLSQIKNMYKDDWGTLLGNCDTFLFLGSPEMDTLEYVSKKLGKKTAIVRSNSISNGGKSSSLSYQKVARELMLPDEIALMNENEALLMVRNQRPFKDRKFDYPKHKNYKFTGDCDSSKIFYFVPPSKPINKKVILEKIDNDEKSSFVNILNNSRTNTENIINDEKKAYHSSIHAQSINKKYTEQEVEERFIQNFLNENGEVDNDKIKNIEIPLEWVDINRYSETIPPEPSMSQMSNIV